MSERPPIHQYDHPITRFEHDDLKERVRVLEAKLDRITWLVIATLATTVADLVLKIRP
jgi:hypothetical protein